MEQSKITIERDKKVALVAHDNKKRDLVEWAKYNRVLLAHHTIYATGTTGTFLEQELGFPIHKADFMISSPLMDEEYDRLLPEYDEYRNRTRV